jgi:DNA polymerase-3 subunit epsilon
MDIVAVIDFETTGFSVAAGDRPTEIAVVLVENRRIVDRFQRLMNPGRRISRQAAEVTGITDAMVASAPAVSKVMADAFRFAGKYPLVAHNASFDRSFWDAELSRIGKRRVTDFVCTQLVSRRMYPEASNYRLGTLIEELALPRGERAHRALADAVATAHLWCRIERDANRLYRRTEGRHGALAKAQRIGKQHFARLMEPA